MVMGLFNNLFGGGGGGGPTPLGMFANGAAPAAGAGSGGGGGFGGRLVDHLNNPIVAAALGAGGGLIQAGQQGQSTLGGLTTGLGAGIGGYAGARSARQEKSREKERADQIRKIIERLDGIGQQARQPATNAGLGGSVFGGTGSGPIMDVRNPLYTGLF